MASSSPDNPTDSIPEKVPAIVFDDLLKELKEEGFAVGLQDYLEFTAIFQQYGGDRDRLKYYLAPILCRNKEEQEKFYAIYDEHTTIPSSQLLSGWPSKDEQSTPNIYLPRPFKNFYFRALFLLLLIGGSKGLQLLRHRQHIIPPVHAVTKPDSLDNTADAPVTRRRTGPVFVAKALRPSVDSSEKSRIIAIGPPIEKENSVYSTAFARLLVLGLVCLGLSATFFPQKKSRFLPEVDLDTLRGDEVPLDIPFPSKDDLIQQLPALKQLSLTLRQPIPTEIYRLDIHNTIRESVRNYGLLEPFYYNMERKPEYLVLIDKGHGLLAQLYRCLAQALTGEGVRINTYFYLGAGVSSEDSAEFYPEPTAAAVNIYTLQERHSGARLILLGNDPYAPLPEGLDHWNTDEVEWIEKFHALTEAPEGQTGYYPPENMDLLREYLGSEDLFQWVCALAIYPSIQWEVLIAVGHAVLSNRQTVGRLNYTNLLRIARLPWLSGATIPLPVRKALLQKLDLPAEIAARKALLVLLRESDELIADSPFAGDEQLLQIYTQSFVLYAHDVRRNRQYEEEAKKFMALWNKKKIPDLATVIYLKNQDRQWQTPLRSVDDPQKPVDANRFLNELVARRVISDPRIRAFFRNAALVCGLLLLSLFLFKDNIVGLGINSTLGLIERDYRTNDITVTIPLTDCLKKKAIRGQLAVSLNNYDNNRYTQTFSIVDKDSLNVRFEGITMAGKSPGKTTFQLFLGKDLIIDCPYTEFYSQYTVLLGAADCDSSEFRPTSPNYYPRQPHALTQ